MRLYTVLDIVALILALIHFGIPLTYYKEQILEQTMEHKNEPKLQTKSNNNSTNI